MKRRGIRKYKFDAALSFAGEDRSHARRLAARLKAKGYSIFYDEDFRADLWGKRQDEYEQIYGPRSKFVIPLISRHYSKKEWTLFEFESAKREAKRRQGEFILPVRIDNTRLLGLSDDVNYFSLGAMTIEDIAADFAKKCGSPLDGRKTVQATRKRQKTLTKGVTQLLARETRQALGLVATASAPLRARDFKKVFPDLDWSKHLRRLARNSLIGRAGEAISVPREVRRLFQSQTEGVEFSKLWIKALRPVRWYPDTALFLAPHYLRVGRLNDAVHVLADVAESTDLRDWNEAYLTTLLALTQKRIARKSSSESKCKLYNAIGICLVRVGKPREALRWFKRLRSYSRRVGNKSWIGQSLINAGVAYHNIPQEQKAIQHYRRAIEHGKISRDQILVARAQGNLASQILPSMPQEAERLLQCSLATKRKLRDRAGLIVTYAQMGRAQAVSGQPDRAIRYYLSAKRTAEKIADRAMLAGILNDLGNAYYECGLLNPAIRSYRRAHRIASDEGYRQVEIAAATGEGRICFQRGHRNRALRLFEKVLLLAEATNDESNKISALHAVGLILMLQGRARKGHLFLNRALLRARRVKDNDWVARCLTDRCRRVVHQEFEGFDRTKLKRAAIAEQKRRCWSCAGKLWQFYADQCSEDLAEAAEIERALGRSRRCFHRQGGCEPELVNVLIRYYTYLWKPGKYTGVLKALRDAEHIARTAHIEALAAAVTDQRGVCLQELGRHREAVGLHRQAVRRSRKLGDARQVAISLNNLGEALRKLGRLSGAMTALEEAEEAALLTGDHGGAIGAAGNRALVLQERGDHRGAIRIFRRCQRQALRHGLRSEYVASCSRLAVVAWEQGDFRTANIHFRDALSLAKKYKQDALIHQIALNYSRFLLARGEAPRALRELSRHEASFAANPDAYLFHYTLGELHQEVGDSVAAKRHLKLGSSSARVAENADYIAMCAAKLAEVYEAKRAFSRSAEQLQVALAHEPSPVGRAVLLSQLLHVQLASGKTKNAQKTLNEAQVLATQSNLADVYVNIHLQVADHGWRGNRTSKLEALKAYTVAMLKAIEIDVEFYGHICGHVAHVLTRSETAPSEGLLKSLREDLCKWFGREIGGTAQQQNMAMWPFTMVTRLLPFAGRPRQLGAEMQRFFKSDEFSALVGRG